MGNYLQLPEGSPLPFRRSPRPRPVGGVFFILLSLFIVCAAGYVVVKYWPSIFPSSDMQNVSPRAASPGPLPTSVATAEAEDLLHHLDTAINEERKASEDLKRSQDWIERVAPALDRNYMTLELRRLHAATVMSDIVADRKARMESLARRIASQCVHVLHTSLDQVHEHGILASVFYREPNQSPVPLFQSLWSNSLDDQRHLPEQASPNQRLTVSANHPIKAEGQY